MRLLLVIKPKSNCVGSFKSSLPSPCSPATLSQCPPPLQVQGIEEHAAGLIAAINVEMDQKARAVRDEYARSQAAAMST